MATFKDSIKGIAGDLLNIEVNTIVTPGGLTARKMPEPPDAMLDIFEKYEAFLRAAATEANARLDAGDDFLDDRERTEGRIRPTAEAAAFFKLRKWGSKILWAGEATLTPETRIIIDRIRRNSGRIERVFVGLEQRGYTAKAGEMGRDDLKDRTKLTAMRLLPGEMTVLRKIWEVGVEKVLMQSVIQIDGDVVTRIRAGRETDKDKELHDLHAGAVNVSLRHWQFLVKTLTTFLSSAIGSLWGGRS